MTEVLQSFFANIQKMWLKVGILDDRIYKYQHTVPFPFQEHVLEQELEGLGKQIADK